LSEVELLGAFQLAIQQSIKAMKLADMATGTVLSETPLAVQLDVSVPPIPEQALLLTDAVKPKSVTAPVQGGEGGTVTVVIQEALKAGDKVLMLRVMKGQKYVILSRL